MKYQSVLLFLTALLICTISPGCEDDPIMNPDQLTFNKGEGVFITQEGSFNAGNGVLSYFDYKNDTLIESVYQKINGDVVGSLLQGAFFGNNTAYLIVNGSGLIIEIDPSKGEVLNYIDGLSSPNDFIMHDEVNGYLSDLFGPYLYKVDLLTNSKSDSLFVDGGTGEIEIMSNQLFITKSSDYLAPPSTSVFVADLNTFKITDTITVGFNPTSIVQDRDGQLWVLCNGNAFEDIKGGLYRINPTTKSVSQTIEFPDLNTSYAGRLETDEDGSNIFFLKGDVFKMAMSATSFPGEPIISSEGKSYYGLGIRPDNGDIYISVEDFNTESKILIHNSSGIIQAEMDSKVGANHFYFY
jgi:hypothetical protein